MVSADQQPADKPMNTTTDGTLINKASLSTCRDPQNQCLAWSKVVPIADQVENLLKKVHKCNQHETEYLQAVDEVMQTLFPVFEKHPKYIPVMEQILEPERIIIFRVPWIDDQGIQQINRGYRVQYSSALGPYKGGIRFHPTVTLSTMKFLAFEQIFKNALTGTQIGGGKGGSDFDPKGKSSNEIMRFCQSFMTALWQYIGPTIDVPSGDINVGKREIGYLYGQYKKLTYTFDGTFTGKGLEYSGSHIRPEATGYGVVYFLMNWAEKHSCPIAGQKCVVSGSGNVAQFATEKLIELGAIVLTLSDSSGYVLEPEGFTQQQLQHIMTLKNLEKKRISEYCQYSKTAIFYPYKKPWTAKAYTFAFPCATQNEVDEEDAKAMKAAGCKVVIEGANMPSTSKAAAYFKHNKITLCPAKAANAGGVAVSALEMAQNASRSQWSREVVNEELKKIMKEIYISCESAASTYGCEGDLCAGANIAGFLKVADAVIQQGCI